MAPYVSTMLHYMLDSRLFLHYQLVPRVYVFVSIMKTVSTTSLRILRSINTIYPWLSWKQRYKSLCLAENTQPGNSGYHGNQSVAHCVTHTRLLRKIRHVSVTWRAAVLFAYYFISNAPAFGETIIIFKINNKFAQILNLWHFQSLALWQHHFTIHLSDFSYLKFNFWVSMFICP